MTKNEGKYPTTRPVGGRTVAQIACHLLLMRRQWMQGRRLLPLSLVPHCYTPDITGSSAFHPESLCGCLHIQFWEGLHCLTQPLRRAEQVKVSARGRAQAWGPQLCSDGEGAERSQK